METTLGSTFFITTWTESSNGLQEIVSGWSNDNDPLPNSTTDPDSGTHYIGPNDDDDDIYNSNASGWFNFTTEELTTFPELIHKIPPYLGLKIVMCTICLVITFFGNALVIYAYATVKKLRTYTNHYIVGLATADLISGGIIPGFENILLLIGYWPFNEASCAALQYLIHVFIQATFMLTLVICYDRFRALNMPLKHLKEKNFRHACFMIFLGYIIPVLIWTPIIIIFPYSGFTIRIRPPLCHGSYAFHPPLLIFAILVLSWIPMAATVILYAFVYRAVIRKGVNKKRGIGEERSSDEKSENQASQKAYEERNELRAKSYHPDNDPRSEEDTTKEHPAGTDPTPSNDRVYTISAGLSLGLTNQAYEQTEDNDNSKSHPGTTIPPSKETTMSLKQRRPGVSTRSRRSKREGRLASLRATRTLTYILVTTVVSAMPWSIFALWAAIDPYNFPISDNEFKFLAWLAHLSSTVNPFCYAVCHPIFKEAFLQIFCCCRNAQPPRSSSMAMRSQGMNKHPQNSK